MARDGRKTKPKMSFSQLTKRIQQGTLLENEARAAFRHDEGDVPFRPKVVIDRRHIDVSGVEDTAQAMAGSLARDAARAVARNPRSRFSSRALNRSAPFRTDEVDNPQIIAEGDSWFKLPDFYEETMITFLARSRRVLNIGQHGDTLSQMLAARQYAEHLDQPFVQALLFSAGGNDVLGVDGLSKFVRQRSSGDQDPDKVARYIKPAFKQMLDEVEGQWRWLMADVRKINRRVVIFAHGYDHIIPRRNGRWVGKQLEFRGFTFDSKKARAQSERLVEVMINRYNSRLAKLARDNDKFVHVRVTETVPKARRPSTWWKDELHPNKKAAQLLAEKFDAALTANGIGEALS